MNRLKLYSENDKYKLYQGNMLDMLETIEKESIDAIVCDPPYGLTSITKRFGKEDSVECQYGKDGSFQRLSKGFMGKEWDGSGIEYNIEAWEQCYEVLKPGGYLLAFGGSRTYHRIACAIEDAGFEIRDTIMWLYGSGFPKSMSLSKGLEAREKLGNAGTRNKRKIEQSCDTKEYILKQTNNGAMGELIETTRRKYIPNTELAKQWSGWGTALKPSFEPIIVARKPFKGSCVDNVIKYGVGGINIDECRVGTDIIKGGTMPDFRDIGEKSKEAIGINKLSFGQVENAKRKSLEDHIGRFPANTILTYDETDFEEVCGEFPTTGKDSASRYFMNCKYTGKDEEIWKQLLVNNVESNLEILKATKDNIVQMNVEDLLKELKDHYAKYVGNQLDLTETFIVQDIVEMLTWDFKIGTSQVIQDFIINSKKCIQFLNLVQFVEKMDNIDTTKTTQNLLKLFGYVKVVITNYILGNIEYDQKRYIYTPKASKKDRDEGLEEFEEKGAKELLNREENSDGASWNGKYSSGNAYAGAGCPKKNTHPTVKPTTLMQYLIRLVTPNGGTVLDPFNGSGSTGKAVMYENKERNKDYKYIGIELTEEYLPIAKARIEYVCNLKEEQIKDMQMSIFDLGGDSNE